MFEKRVYLYAINRETGALESYQYLTNDYIYIRNIAAFAHAMKQAEGDHCDIWACDGSRELADCARPLFKRHLLEDVVAFKDYVERNGLKIE